MLDSRKHSGGTDLAHINVNDAGEMLFWIQELRSSEAQIHAAVAKVGASSDAVREELMSNTLDFTADKYTCT